MPDENGETRRERNAKFGEPTPDIEPPEQAEHVWEWFFQLSAQRRSGPEMLSFGDIGEWSRLTGQIVRPEEITMLLAMDSAFVAGMRQELKDQRERNKPNNDAPQKPPPKKLRK